MILPLRTERILVFIPTPSKESGFFCFSQKKGSVCFPLLIEPDSLFDDSKAFDIDLVITNEFGIHFAFDTNQRFSRYLLPLKDVIVDFNFNHARTVTESIMIALDAFDNLPFQCNPLVVLTVF